MERSSDNPIPVSLSVRGSQLAGWKHLGLTCPQNYKAAGALPLLCGQPHRAPSQPIAHVFDFSGWGQVSTPQGYMSGSPRDPLYPLSLGERGEAGRHLALWVGSWTRHMLKALSKHFHKFSLAPGLFLCGTGFECPLLVFTPSLQCLLGLEPFGSEICLLVFDRASFRGKHLTLC